MITEQASSSIQQCDPEPLKREIEQLRQQLADQTREQMWWRDRWAGAVASLEAKLAASEAREKAYQGALYSAREVNHHHKMYCHRKEFVLGQTRRAEEAEMQLAASQAREKALRDAMQFHAEGDVDECVEACCECKRLLEDPPDHKALEAYVAERVKKACGAIAKLLDSGNYRRNHLVVDTRALP